MPTELAPRLVPGDHRVAVVLGRFNEFIGKQLLEGALDTWKMLGGRDENLTLVHVPGAFEMPAAARNLADTGKYAAIVCLGCVIRGETTHYDHVVGETAKGIKDVNVLTGVPCIFGVLTCDTLEQAIHRAGAKLGNQGRYAMLAGVEMANLVEKIKGG